MKIELTDSEIEVVMKALEHFASAPHSVREGVCIDEINELSDDIREQDARRDDGWGDAETEMFDAGVDARERVKATSRAAGRRALAVKFVPPGSPNGRSEVQKHDVFDCEWNPDDPKNW